MGNIIRQLVSTIIPVHNRATMLGEAVASVLAQTYRPIEIIIVNDGSTDDTAQVIDELVRAHRETVRVIYQTNAGPGVARETGRLAARGEFIQYLDSDDLLLPEKFEVQVAGLRERPECGLSYGKTRHYRRGAAPTDIPWKRTGLCLEFLFPALLKERVWSTVTPLFRRAVTDRVGPWTDLRQHEDWEYDCRVAALGVPLHYCHRFVAEVRMHDGDALSDQWTRDLGALRDRALAYILMYHHARRGGLDHTVPEMQHFAREAFLVARQCGARGLPSQSRALFQLARAASGARRAGWDFGMYRAAAAVLGWKVAGILACVGDRLRHPRPVASGPD